VAVLDVLKAPARTQPFVLLQPHPRLEDVLGAKELASAARNGRLPNLERAFVGLTPRGALFALAPARYPLVVFSDSGRVYQPSLDGLGRDDAPLTVDEMARRRAWNKLCADGANMDPRCLVGPKDLGASGSGLSRLLIDAATPLPSSEPHRETELPPGPTHSFGTARDWPVNTTPSKKFPQIEGRKLVRTVGDGTVIGIPGLEVQSVVAMTIVSLGFLLALFWYKRAPFAAAATSSSIKVPHVAVAADPAITDETAVKAPIKAKFTDKVTHVQVTTAAAEDSDFVHVSADDGVPDTPAVPATPLTPGPDAGEDDSEGEEGAGPRRRRPRRRGKKKRGGAKEVAEDAGVEPVTTSSSDEKVPAKPPLMVPAPIVPSTAASSLVVSEEVLGKTTWCSAQHEFS
jgi:serine/threonine-protein kinase/endoribonuclease IRE1